METVTETGLVLPGSVQRSAGVLPQGPQRGVIVNETNLPDAQVRHAIETLFEEHASVLGVSPGNSFSSYSNGGGSLLARAKFQTPKNVLEEIILARDLAERDDDVASTIGMMLAMAFGEGMMHTHEDEVTVALFDKIAKHTNLDLSFQEIYRELLIASQVVTVALFTRTELQIKPQGADRSRTRDIIAPLIGVLPSEQIRVLDDDTFRTGTLAYKPATGAQEQWLREFFAPATSPGRKAEMRRENPVLTSLLVEQRILEGEDTQGFMAVDQPDPAYGNEVYVLNPRMVDRSTFPKGAAKYPRPLMTRDFSLLEAKRLLNIMDHALLQGGSNFLVVAKKGSDERPAMPEEISNLHQVVRRASASGVIIGDHRLSIEIITPDLEELLNAQKRGMLGRKIATALLRLPAFSEEKGGGQAVLKDAEIVSRVIHSDRRLVRRHVENNIYDDVVERNPTQFQSGPASIWFPKIVLQGLQYFTDLVLKLRDRGDISRRSAVQAGGFDYDAEVQARRREKPDDRIMTAPVVPFSGAGGGGQDPQGGRPPGGSRANGAPGSQPSRSTQDPARPRRTIQRTAGETVRAIEEDQGIVRAGENTYRVLEEYGGGTIGRVTPAERDALDRIEAGVYEPVRDGTLMVFPLNGEYAITDIRAVRLSEGLSMLVGNRDGDGAVIARALTFRAPHFTPVDAQATALQWGFECDPLQSLEVLEELAAAAPPTPASNPELHIHLAGGVTKKVVRDEHGNITSIEEIPAT